MKTKLILFLVVISSLLSCETDYYYGVEYVFKNNTKYQVEIICYGYIYSTNDKVISRIIDKGDTMLLKIDGQSPERYRELEVESNYLIPTFKSYRFFGDSLKVFFDKERFVKITMESDSFIYDRSRYESKRLGDNEFRHIFTITEEDYNKALPIGELED